MRLFLLAACFILADSRMLQHHEHFSDDSGGFCANPVEKGPLEFPEWLAGRAKVDFDMWAGYVPVTKEDWLYYLFFETADHNKDAPLVIWTNGGPGCSSMEGATTEHGPLKLFDIKENCDRSNVCDYTNQLSKNPYSWNAHANVIYVDQPRYVGNSGGYGKKVTSSTEAAADFIAFYFAWLEKFPEFKGRPVIFAGESYGGHYIPAFVDAALRSPTPVPLAGALIGNGCINNTVQNGDKYVEFLHAENLIPANATPKGQVEGEAEMIKFLEYTPNYYDYRAQVYYEASLIRVVLIFWFIFALRVNFACYTFSILTVFFVFHFVSHLKSKFSFGVCVLSVMLSPSQSHLSSLSLSLAGAAMGTTIILGPIGLSEMM